MKEKTQISFFQRHLNNQAVALNENKNEILIFDLQKAFLKSKAKPPNKDISFSSVVLVSQYLEPSSEFSCYNNLISPEFSIHEGEIKF